MRIEQAVSEQQENRKRWNEHDTPERVAAMLTHEAEELEQELNEAYLTGDVTAVASEIGDIGYLLLRICEMTGINLEQAIEMKCFRNAYKYADFVVGNEREYDSATRIAKEAWAAMGGDKAWSKVYLDYLAHD